VSGPDQHLSVFWFQFYFLFYFFLSLRHAGLHSIISSGYVGKDFVLLQPLVAYRSLRQILKEPVLVCEGKLSLALDTASALAFLHAREIYHLHLTSEHVLVTPDRKGLLQDYGVLQNMDPQEVTEILLGEGNLGYLRPGSSRLPFRGSEVDTYSLGIIIGEMVLERPPVTKSYTGGRPTFLSQAILAPATDTDPFSIRSQLLAISRECLRETSSPTAFDIKAHLEAILSDEDLEEV